MNLEKYGTVADVQMDATPLQIYTQGRYNKRAFQLIGRVRVGWENGFWNEWAALFDNGEYGWLAEAQGFYAMCFPSDAVDTILPSRELIPGMEIALRRSRKEKALTYQVDDIKQATCIGSEGELPFVSPIGRKMLSVDLSTNNGLFASIEYSEEGTRAFFGEYLNFDEYKFSYLRELDGW